MTDIFDKSYDQVEIKIDNSIQKGGDVNLTARDPTLRNIMVAVGWDTNAFDSDVIDVDVSCFMLDKNGKTRMNEDFVFYNNLESGDGAVIFNGDNRTGAGDGDDESLSIDLNGVSFDIIKLMFVLSIYQGDEKEQKLSKVRNCYIRVVNRENSQEMLRYDLDSDLEDTTETAMLVASLNREGPKWHFEAIGEMVEGGLAKVATQYDIIVQGG